MLQWRPGSETEVLWNDRDRDRFVCHILDIKTGKRRTISHPVYSVSPDGQSAVTPDGRYAVISGGPRAEPLSQEVGYLYVIDLESRSLVATVTGVGNDPYGVAIVER